MSRIRLAAFAVLFALSWGVFAPAADSFDALFRLAEAAPWGAGREETLASLPGRPILGNHEIILREDELAGRTASVNYLFDKSGGLYNITWHMTTPLDDFAAALALEHRLEAALGAKYGQPVLARVDGDPGRADEARANVATVRRAMDKIARLTEGRKGGALSPEEAAALFADKDFLAAVPAIVYRRLLFWNDGGIWICASLACGADGVCVQQTHFIAGNRTGVAAETYIPSPGATDGYSPLERDQDMVTKINRTWEREKRLRAETTPWQ